MEAAIHYAKMVIKGRWPEVERILLSGDFDYMCYLYAKDVIKGRWIEAEPVIMKNIYQNNLYIHGLFFLGYKDFESVLRDPSVSEFFAGPSPLESGPLESCWDEMKAVLADGGRDPELLKALFVVAPEKLKHLMMAYEPGSVK